MASFYLNSNGIVFIHIQCSNHTCTRCWTIIWDNFLKLLKMLKMTSRGDDGRKINCSKSSLICGINTFFHFTDLQFFLFCSFKFINFRLNLNCLLDLLDFVSCFCRYLLPLSLCCAYRHQQKPCIYRWYWLSYSATPSNFLK